jgi:hypothetical protein
VNGNSTSKIILARLTSLDGSCRYLRCMSELPLTCPKWCKGDRNIDLRMKINNGGSCQCLKNSQKSLRMCEDD